MLRGWRGSTTRNLATYQEDTKIQTGLILVSHRGQSQAGMLCQMHLFLRATLLLVHHVPIVDLAGILKYFDAVSS